MNTDSVNPWLTFGANVAVLIGLALVVAEIRQNTAIAELQFSQNRSLAIDQFELLNLDSDFAQTWAKSVQQPQSLTPAEYRMMDSYLAMRLEGWNRIYEMEERGYEPPGTTERTMQNAGIWFGNAFAQTWWKYERLGRNGDLDPYQQLFDRVISEVKPDENQNWINNLKKDIAGYSPAPVKE